MDRSQKNELVSDLKQRFQESALIIVAQQSGLTVSESLNLRREMRKAGAEFKVIKNTLAKLSVQDTSFAGLSASLKGPTAIAFSKDPIAAAKAVATFAKANNKLSIVAGCLNGTMINEEGVKALASLPSLDELRARLLGVIVAPASKLARLSQEPAAQLARVFAARGRE